MNNKKTKYFGMFFLVVLMLGFVSAETNVSIMYLENSSGSIVPAQMDDDGYLKVDLDLLNITAGDIASSGNFTLGDKITFALGEMVDNLVNGWVRVTGNLNVSEGNFSLGGKTLRNNNGTLFWGDTELYNNVSINYGQNASGSILPYKLSGDGVFQMDIIDELWDKVNGVVQPVTSSDSFQLGTFALYFNSTSGNIQIGEDFVVNNSNLYVNVTSGNVGIGTASPTTKLQSSASFDQFSINDAETDNKWYFGTADNVDLYISNDSGASDTKFTIKQSGSVGIGTVIPGAKLDVNGTIIINDVLTIRDVGVSGVSMTYADTNLTTKLDSAGKNIHFRVYNGGYYDRLSIRYNGDIGIGTDPDAYHAAASDVRLKTNIKSIESALDKVISLRGVTFNWKKNYSDDQNLKYGFIAQEVQNIFPNSAEGIVYNTGSKVILKDESKTSVENVLNIKDSNQFSAILVEAIKELNTKEDSRYEELSAENDELKQVLCEELGRMC